jgi:CRP-like cAMP-binding protein
MSQATLEASKLWHLKQCPLFTSLGPDETKAIFLMTHVQSYAPQRVIHPDAMDEDSLFIMKRGHAKLAYTDAEGRQVTVMLLNPGDIFGALPGSEEGGFGEHVTMITSCCVAKISREKFNDILRKYPDLAYKVTNANFDRIRRLQVRLAEYMTMSAEARLALILLELDKVLGKECDEGRELDIQISHQDLGELIGSTREMVSHLMRRFRDSGVVQTMRQRVILCDQEELRRIRHA